VSIIVIHIYVYPILLHLLSSEVCIICIIFIGVVCGIDVDVDSEYMVYAYNCVYYCDT
jgi:hypothetical protein